MFYNYKSVLLLVIEVTLITGSYCDCPPYNRYPDDNLACKSKGQSNYRVIQTNHGSIGGKCSFNKIGKTKVCDYVGVPYAKPPIGPLRFKPPQKLPDWSGIEWALGNKPCCMQMVKPNFTQSEDCLYLNIHVPKKCTPRKPCAVVVWIHGGGFMFGCGRFFKPDYFMRDGVVLVTINYRLGPFGFLNAGHKDSAGNQGMLDQTETLKWVNENILNFGGDPNSVSIYGESAGAASVCFHCMSELSRGLFNRCEMQSGNCLTQWAFMENPIDIFNLFIQNVGLDGNECPANLINQLLDVPAIEIINAAVRVYHALTNIQQLTIWTPTVDSANNPPFLKDTPRKILKHRIANKEPTCFGADLLAGTAVDEGADFLIILQANPNILNAIEANHEMITPLKCGYSPGSPQSIAAGHAVYNRYFSGGPTKLQLIRYLSCSAFIDGLYDIIALNVEIGKKAFTYIYKLRGPRASYWRNTILGNDSTWDRIGAAHADDVFMEFPGSTLTFDGFINLVIGPTNYPPVPEPNLIERSCIRRFVGSLTSYTKTGNPAPAWPPVTDLSDIKSYIFDTKDSFETNPYAEDMRFWAEMCPP